MNWNGKQDKPKRKSKERTSSQVWRIRTCDLDSKSKQKNVFEGQSEDAHARKCNKKKIMDRKIGESVGQRGGKVWFRV